MLYYTKYSSIVGELTIVSDKENIIGVWIKGQKYFCNNIKEKMEKRDNLPIFYQTKKWFDRYFSGENPEIKEIPLKTKLPTYNIYIAKLRNNKNIEELINIA